LPGFDPAIYLLKKKPFDLMDARVIKREDARSLVIGRAFARLVGAFARA
jgi:hypothetical protein